MVSVRQFGLMLLVFVFLSVSMLPAAGFSMEIENPQAVSFLKTQIDQIGQLSVAGRVDSLLLNLSIPQSDDYQIVDFTGASHNYTIIQDQYGNNILQFNIENPDGIVDYWVTSIVETRRRTSIPPREHPAFLEPTSLVQSTDPEIAGLAEIGRGSAFEKVAILSKWINENIEYDRVFSDVNTSAKQILLSRKGVCDEFSNLLLSFTRNLGMRSGFAAGFVHPGRVYSGTEFQPHGWTEVYEGDGILSDPTWAEVGYLDATHIKFATLPDSQWQFVSAGARGFGDIGLKLLDQKTEVRVLDFEEDPLVKDSSVLLGGGSTNKNLLIKTSMEFDGCVLTKIAARSCSLNGGSLLEHVTPEEEIVYFCGSRDYFSLFSVPSDLKSGSEYTCPLTISSYAGGNDVVDVVLRSPESNGGVELILNKDRLSEGDEIVASSPGALLFTDFGLSAEDHLVFDAPASDFLVYAYKDGLIDSGTVHVSSDLPLEVTLDGDAIGTVGEPVNLTVRVENLDKVPRVIEIVFNENSTFENLALSDSAEFELSYIPETISDNIALVFVKAGDYSTSVSKRIVLIEKEKTFWEKLIAWFMELFSF